jgi:hypothetical protein
VDSQSHLDSAKQAAIHIVAEQKRIEEVRRWQEQQAKKEARERRERELAAESRRRSQETKQGR